MKEKVLIVEDQSIEALNLERILTKGFYRVSGVAKSVEKAQQLIAADKPDLVLLDIFLKGTLTGIDLAYQLRKQDIPFIYLSANSSQETLDAAKATCPGGFLVKPVREKDIFVMIEIARYKHMHGLESVSQKWHQNDDSARKELTPSQYPNPVGLSHQTTVPGDIIGNSEKLKEVLRYVHIVAPTDTGVLILGESGTGKEKIAQAIHDLSGRKAAPFIKVNCAALPVNLIESILFGHEKGAFTGALDRHTGKFEQASGGTIFLDEIGEIPPEVQVKLLRVLQENEVERLGGKGPLQIDVRVIAATNRNLEKEVAEGRFRMDLYYRLNVFPLYLPALRERKEDIPLLASHFVAQYCSKFGKPVLQLSPVVTEEIIQYAWPGNIRELQHVMERSVLLTTGDTIRDLYIIGTKHNLPAADTGFDSPVVKSIDENEKDYILKILKLCKGRIGGKDGAAELLQIPPSTLQSKMKRLGIRREHFG